MAGVGKFRCSFLTQKERDSESGLDYFLARYYSSAQGRFTGPDEPFADQDEGDPQTWNLYTYGRNNPLLYTDPFGLWKEIAPGIWQWEEDDTWETLADKLKVDVTKLKDAFGDVALEPGTVVQPGDLTNPGVAARNPSSEIATSGYNAFLGTFGEYIRENQREDGLIPDPSQIRLSRWIFGTRWIDPSTVAPNDWFITRLANEFNDQAGAGALKAAKFERVARQALAANGPKARGLLEKLARMAGLTVESGGNHNTVVDSAGKVVTQIPNSPHGSGTIREIVNKIRNAAGL